MQIQAGQLRERITIQAVVRTRDRAGQPVASTSTLAADVPADVVSLSGVEIVQGQQVTGVATHRVFLRHRSGITPQHQIAWRGRTLGIVAVRDADNRRRLLSIDCKEAV